MGTRKRGGVDRWGAAIVSGEIPRIEEAKKPEVKQKLRHFEKITFSPSDKHKMKEIGKQVNENSYQIHNILDLGSSQGINVE